MYNVYANLRKCVGPESTTLNLHRSGFKVKLAGGADETTDAGFVRLVEEQTAAHFDAKGTVESEAHKGQYTRTIPKALLIAIVQGQEITTQGQEETPKAAKGRKAKVEERGGIDPALNGSHETVK